MRKIFKNKKILFPAIVSFCLLFFALVGVRSVQSAACSVNGPTGTCTQASCPTGTSELTLGTLPQAALDDQCTLNEDVTTTNWKCCAKPPANQLCVGNTAAEPLVTANGNCLATCSAENTITETGTPVCTSSQPVCCYIPPPAGKPDCKAAGGVCKANLCVAPEQDVTNQVAPETNCATVDPNTPYCCVAAPATTPDATPSTQNPAPTPSDEESWLTTAVVFLINIGILLLGKLLVAVFELIVKVSQFNDIVNSYFVVTGWIVLRDLVNMFFVLGLLFIAFVTVLKIERYQWQKLLPKLLLMAVVVNFSRTICGLMIDFFQVIMFTFVNAYKDIVAGNLWKALGFNDMWDLSSNTGDVGNLALIAGRLLGLIYIIVALIVSLIFLIILVFRIIMLWVLVVFSPLAFFSAAFNGISGKIGSYWGQWFKQFIEYCMVGPLLAFFLWLSILSMGSDYNTMYAQRMSPGVDSSGQQQMTTVNKAGRLDYIMKYVLGILMLVAGLKFTADTKVMGSSLAGKAASKIQDATAGRMERWAGGAYDLGKKYTGMGVKESLGRVERSGGVSGRLAKWARLVGTKEGRQTLGERTEAQIKSKAGGKKGALVEQRQKEIDRYQKEFELMGADKNPEVLKKLLSSATGDRRIALMNIKGDQGKMDKETFDKALADGDFEHFGIKTKKDGTIDFEKSDQGGLANLESLGKKWEDAYEKKNNLPISITPFVRNPVTNDWERVAPGAEGEKRKLQDTEETLAKQGRDATQKGISSGDFAKFKKAEDILLMGTHLSGVGKNSYLKNAGQAAQDKYKEQADLFAAITTGDEVAQKEIIKKEAEKKGLKKGDAGYDAFEKEQMDLYKFAKKKADENPFSTQQLKNIQKGYEVSTGEWEPGSGRGTTGSANDALAKSIRDKQAVDRGQYTALKNSNPTLLGQVDALLPEPLKTFQALPEAQQIEGIRKHLNTALGMDTKAAGITDDFLKESIKFSPDIIAQDKVKTDLSGSVTSAMNAAAALARKGKDTTPEEINKVVASLLSTVSAGEHSADSAGMSADFFKFDKLKDLAEQMKTMVGLSKKKQQELIQEIAAVAQADGYFNGKIPSFDKKGGKNSESSSESSGGGSGSAPAPAPSGGPGGGSRGGVEIPTVISAPSSTTVNIVSNVTQNLTNTSAQVLSSTTDPLALKEAIKQTLKPMLDSSIATLKEKFGDQFTVADKAKLYQRFDAVEAAAVSGEDMKSVRNKVESEMNKLTDEIDSLKKTFKS